MCRIINKLLLVLFTSLLISNSAFAGSCNELKVKVINNFPETCIVIDYLVPHGHLMSGDILNVPGNGGVNTFTVVGSGADVGVKYSCGNEPITLYSMQNWCVLEAGNIHGYTKDKWSGGSVDATVQVKKSGSYRHHGGYIEWVIFKK